MPLSGTKHIECKAVSDAGADRKPVFAADLHNGAVLCVPDKPIPFAAQMKCRHVAQGIARARCQASNAERLGLRAASAAVTPK